jgi:hypothetical protein
MKELSDYYYRRKQGLLIERCNILNSFWFKYFKIGRRKLKLIDEFLDATERVLILEKEDEL